MTVRGRTTFQKRQKEMDRKDKQQRKAARRAQRKLDLADPDRPSSQEMESPLESEPESEPKDIEPGSEV